MPTIYTNKDYTSFVHCNENQPAITTIRIKGDSTEVATIKGEEAKKLILSLKHDLKYNFDGNALFICPVDVFAEALHKAQRQVINSLNSINQFQTV